MWMVIFVQRKYHISHTDVSSSTQTWSKLHKYGRYVAITLLHVIWCSPLHIARYMDIISKYMYVGLIQQVLSLIWLKQHTTELPLAPTERTSRATSSTAIFSLRIIFLRERTAASIPGRGILPMRSILGMTMVVMCTASGLVSRTAWRRQTLGMYKSLVSLLLFVFILASSKF